jgi:hypothetical protein
MWRAKTKTGAGSGRRGIRRRRRPILQERNGILAEEPFKAARKASVAEQAFEKGKGGFSKVCDNAEEKLFVREKKLLPLINRGNRDAEPFADSNDGCLPLIEVCDQAGELEPEAIWAIWDQDIGEQRMGRAARTAFETEWADAFGIDAFAADGNQPSGIIPVWCKLPLRHATRAMPVMAFKPIRRFMEQIFID